MTVDPCGYFRAFAAGGTWPTRVGVGNGAVVIALADVSELQRLFTRDAAGLIQDFEGWAGVFASPGAADRMFGLYLRFDDNTPVLRVLFWLDENRDTLAALVEQRALLLCSDVALRALQDGREHGERISLDLRSVNLAPLESTLAEKRHSLRQTEGGWRVELPFADVDAEGVVDSRQFPDEPAYLHALERLMEGPSLVTVWRNDETKTITVATVGDSAPAIWPTASELPRVELSEFFVRSAWAQHELSLARSAATMGLRPPISRAPEIATWQVLDGSGTPVPITVFVTALAYPSEERTREVHASLNDVLFASGAPLYMSRLRAVSPEGESTWCVIALTTDLPTKDRMVVFDWGADGTSVTADLGQETVLRAAQRHLGAADASFALAPVPVDFGPQ